MIGESSRLAGRKTILVSGATGQQGGAVARRLKQGFRVKGLTRNQAKSKTLQTVGIEPVQGDLTDKQGLKPINDRFSLLV